MNRRSFLKRLAALAGVAAAGPLVPALADKTLLNSPEGFTIEFWSNRLHIDEVRITKDVARYASDFGDYVLNIFRESFPCEQLELLDLDVSDLNRPQLVRQAVVETSLPDPQGWHHFAFTRKSGADGEIVVTCYMDGVICNPAQLEFDFAELPQFNL